MAKHKKRHHATHHRRRHVGALSKDQQDAAMTGLGAILGGAIGWFGYTKITGINNALMGVGEAAAGLGLAVFSKEPLVRGLGFGLVATAGIIGGETLGFLSGVGRVTNLPSTSPLRIAGYGDVRQIAGTPGQMFP